MKTIIKYWDLFATKSDMDNSIKDVSIDIDADLNGDRLGKEDEYLYDLFKLS